MRTIAALVICLCVNTASWAKSDMLTLPSSALSTLNRKFPGWQFAEVGPEVRQFFASEMQGALPYLIKGDFDGNARADYAVLIRHGEIRYPESKQSWPRFFLVVFLRKARSYQTHIIKEPNGEYLCLAKKGTKDFDYDKQREITYAHDAIMTGIFEKGGSSYVYEHGRFRSFVSSD